ncbi:MAG: prepilin-type N-terminal cleavage/methylation domain-containing protein [Dehalococcoidia bacterium]|nr:prepilin-type N-terminal cleavage/methylation domain-containing protein [Dehalococcoidia bacterium]
MIKPVENQKGIALIELLVAIALTAIISTAAAMAIHQVITIVPRNNDQNTAINQVRNANHWLNFDIQSATPGSINTTGPNFLSLEQLEWESVSGNWTTHTVDYSLENMAGSSLKVLRRCYDSETVTLIAQYIDPANTNCSWNSAEKVLTVTITAQVGTRTETRTFEVKPRPD